MRDGVAGEKRLVAYVIPSNDTPLVIETLRLHLRAALPEYMTPAAFVTLEAFPLTANGKLDRKALPPPDPSVLEGQNYEAPRGELEEELAEIWKSLLELKRVGRTDNFFELGGHSLLATIMASRAQATFGVPVAIRTIFDAPTIGQLALHVAVERYAARSSDDGDEQLAREVDAMPDELVLEHLATLEKRTTPHVHSGS
jgi:hypothetical protein